jgi:cyclophilin family peptidyl-prolyl cis-trans isomerase
MGTIKVRFFPEYAPKAVQNWKTRAKSGYYDGTIFHRVINDFMIQGGDPEGTGMGGESIWGAPFEMEIDPSLHFIRGALGMARSSDEVSQGSQFFIIQAPTLNDDNKQYVENFKDIQNQVAAVDAEGNKIPIAQFFPLKIIDKYVEDGGYPSLDFNYTVFGQVVEGLDVVDAIAAVETSKDEASLDKPLADVVLESISFEQHS